jgi:hypothetical protein
MNEHKAVIITAQKTIFMISAYVIILIFNTLDMQQSTIGSSLGMALISGVVITIAPGTWRARVRSISLVDKSGAFLIIIIAKIGKCNANRLLVLSLLLVPTLEEHVRVLEVLGVLVLLVLQVLVVEIIN